MRRSALALGLTLALTRSAVAVPPVTFTDANFVDPEWSIVTSSFEVTSITPLPGGTATGAQQNPTGSDAFRAITHNVPPAPSPTTFAAVWSAHFRSGATYDPSVQGPIGSIDYAALEAGVVVLALPCVVLFLILQRGYVRGFMSGSLKG